MGTVVRIVLAVLLVATGWVAAGTAQTANPDFEVIVNAPAGETTIECVRGCNLAWVERGVLRNYTPTPKFPFSCDGLTTTRCSSGRVGGWVSH